MGVFYRQQPSSSVTSRENQSSSVVTVLRVTALNDSPAGCPISQAENFLWLGGSFNNSVFSPNGTFFTLFLAICTTQWLITPCSPKYINGTCNFSLQYYYGNPVKIRTVTRIKKIINCNWGILPWCTTKFLEQPLKEMFGNSVED